MGTTFINPTTLFPTSDLAFSHVAISEGKKLVQISGQVALDKNLKIIGAGDFGAQVSAALNNLGLALEAAGVARTDVSSMRCLIVNYTPDHMGPLVAGLSAFFGVHRPASTWIGVQALAMPELLLEIEAIAVIG
jgi:enamine deaminase RidA (YjgF/YER057c/UK114 family)